MSSKEKQLGSSFEQRVVNSARAKGLKATKQPGSGVFKDFPNDVVIEDLLVECKVRSASISPQGNKTLRIDLGWFDYVRANAKKFGFREGIVVVNAKGSRSPMALVPLDFLLGLLKSEKRDS